MRILFLTQVLPYPLDAGPKVRSYYVLRHLAQAHEVTLVSFVRPSDTPAAIAHLRSFCHQVHGVSMIRSRAKDAAFLLKSLATGQPFIIQRDWVAAMANLLSQLMQNAQPFDAIHADQLWMAPYALQASAQIKPVHTKPRLVLDQHNAVYLIPARLAEDERNPLKRAVLALEARKLAPYEVTICRQFDRVVWVTQADYRAVQSQTTDGRPLPNAGVIPICGDPEAVPALIRQTGAKRVTFLGGLHYPPNAQGVAWFAEKVFPQVLAHVPDALLTVIGKNPPAALRHINLPPANVDITGYVADPDPYLRETAAFVVPLLAGGGMRVKIIDGWTWGLPMVSTTIGAEGIDWRRNEHLLIADTPGEFARHTIHLLQDAACGQRLAQAGRDWVLQKYNWRETYQCWDQVYT